MSGTSREITQIKNACIAPNSNENLEHWSRNTTLILCDSMLPDIEKRRIPKRNGRFKVKYFPRETFDVMHDHINRSIHLKNPENTLCIYHYMTINPEIVHSSGVCDTDFSDFHGLTLIFSKIIHAKHNYTITQ